MRQYEVTDAFGLEQLRCVDRPSVPPGPGQVRLKVLAWSLNYRDLLMVAGQYDPRLGFPFVPLSDCVAEVVEVGDGVALAVGTRVCPLFSPSWVAGPPDRTDLRDTRGGPIPGVLAEELTVAASGVVPVPAYLSDEEAATLPCAALTAWSALVTLGGVTAGDTVLTLGTGGVSVFAVQIARLLGARVVSTTSTADKAEWLRGLGAEHVVLYPDDPRWGRAIKKATGGVDHVVEVGGAGTLEQSLAAVAPGGTVSLIGVVAGGKQPLSILPVFMNQIRVQGVFVGHRRGFEAMCRAFEAHAVRPVVDRVFGFDEVAAAFSWMQGGHHRGKVVIRR